jgi:hypothetical protein
MPAEISGCRNLTFVNLHDNAVAGELPRGPFQDLLSLQYLDLSKNVISGALLLDIGMLTSLTKLILSGNRLSGTVPPEIRSCSRLQLLDLDGNSFSGKIPGSIGKIPGLEIAVNLSCGTIPSEFGGLVRLGVLDVSHNQLSSDLLPLSALQNLIVLNISFNGFTGRLPETSFFVKLPTSDVEGNPALCLSQCAGATDDAGDRSRAARVTVAVLLSALVVLVAVGALILFRQHRRAAGKMESKDGMKMSPLWNMTMYQKLEIGMANVARSLTSANVVEHGWSSAVYRATLASSGGGTIVVKTFQSCDEASVEAFACEVSVLPRVRHRNIVRL